MKNDFWKLFSGKINKNNQIKYQIPFFLVFFVLFSAIISSGLFGPKLEIELGEPSPELIIAPYDKEIEDLTGYHEEQEKAASAVKPVYTSNEQIVTSLEKELTAVFETIRQQLGSRRDLSEKVNALKQNKLLADQPGEILESLLVLSENELAKSEQVISKIILGIARDPDSGAKEEADIPLLRDKMKEQVNKSSLPDSMKILTQIFIDKNIIEPTLMIDEDETRKLKEAASTHIKPNVHKYRANEKIVGPGEIIDEKIFQVLVAYGLVEVKSPWKPTAGIAIHVLIGMIILTLFAYQFAQEIIFKWRKLILIGLAMLLVLVLGKAFLAINFGSSDLNNLTAVLIPVAWATMTVTILLGVRIAVVVGIILSIFTGTMADPASLGVSGSLAGLFSLISGLVGIQSVARLDQRSDLARAGLYIALVNIALISGIALIIQMSPTHWFFGCILGIFNGFLSSALTVGTLPWFEGGFKITSSVRLLELANPNFHLLKSLLMEAPGTYHHSVLVGNLAETAAEQVKADPVLVRVGALYHDIGKLKRPYFFIENQFSKDNPHDKIAPTLSALIVISHVKDGLEMAKEAKLPESIQDIIAQHHGNSLASFFYHKALEDNPDIGEETFRYDGIRPQSKEAALVLLADNVEAAVRSHKGNTPGRIEGLVRKIIKEKFDEGLLDHCDLTFKDLDKISIAFVKVLSGIFHSRVEYPELPSAKLKSGEDSDKEKADKEKADKEQEDPEDDMAGLEEDNLAEFGKDDLISLEEDDLAEFEEDDLAELEEDETREKF